MNRCSHDLSECRISRRRDVERPQSSYQRPRRHREREAVQEPGGRTMKHKLFRSLALMVLAWLGFAANPAGAATTAAGPYYANPSWDQTLPASTRFIMLSNMNGEAVLDRETGLVWEQSPSASQFTWELAQIHCNSLRTGGRLGWRLPTLQELASLVDTSVSPPGPTLPSGHPFSNVQSSYYSSATTY